MLLGPVVHIHELVLLAPMTKAESAAYLHHLTLVWAPLWGVALTVDKTVVGETGVPNITSASEVDALDALLSNTAEAGTDVSPADALSVFLLPCQTPASNPTKVADGFCIASECVGCAGTGVAFLQFVAVPNTKREWHIPATQSTIVRWNNAA